MLLFLLCVPIKSVFANPVFGCINPADGSISNISLSLPSCPAGEPLIVWNGTVDSLPPATGATQFVFKGITTTKVSGGEGVGRYSQLCAEEVSPDSRFCTTKEVLQSNNPFPSPLAEPIWIHPIFMPTGVAAFMDYSGYDLGGTMSCLGWDSDQPSTRGLSLRNQGAVTSMPCNLIQSISCCGPAN